MTMRDQRDTVPAPATGGVHVALMTVRDEALVCVMDPGHPVLECEYESPAVNDPAIFADPEGKLVGVPLSGAQLHPLNDVDVAWI